MSGPVRVILRNGKLNLILNTVQIQYAGLPRRCTVIVKLIKVLIDVGHWKSIIPSDETIRDQ